MSINANLLVFAEAQRLVKPDHGQVDPVDGGGLIVVISDPLDFSNLLCVGFLTRESQPTGDNPIADAHLAFRGRDDPILKQI